MSEIHLPSGLDHGFLKTDQPAQHQIHLQSLPKLRHIRHIGGVESLQGLIQIVPRLPHGTKQHRNISRWCFPNFLVGNAVANKAADGHTGFLCLFGEQGQLVLGEANLHSAISFSQKHSSFLLGFQGHCPRQAESVRTDSLLVKTMPPTPRFKLLRHF